MNLPYHTHITNELLTQRDEFRQITYTEVDEKP